MYSSNISCVVADKRPAKTRKTKWAHRDEWVNSLIEKNRRMNGHQTDSLDGFSRATSSNNLPLVWPLLAWYACHIVHTMTTRRQYLRRLDRGFGDFGRRPGWYNRACPWRGCSLHVASANLWTDKLSALLWGRRQTHPAQTSTWSLGTSNPKGVKPTCA